MNRKGTSDLWSKVISVENLRQAAYTAYDNAEDKTKSMLDFMEDLDNNIAELHRSLTNWTYQTGPYNRFKVYEPKEREISSLPFKDRVVQHAILAVILPIWMKKFTADTYNCLKGRGTHGFVVNMQKAIKNDPSGTKYVLQMDVHHYYPSLNHNTIKKQVRWTIKDKNLQRLIFEIVDSVDEGVPIGNYLSQFLATLYLTPFDHYVKEKLHAKHYFRYCDDLIFFASTKEELWRIYYAVIEYMKGIQLEIKPNARIFPLETGLDVVGYVFFPDHTRLRKRNKIKIMRKCQKAHKAGLVGKAFKVQIGSYIGQLKYCNSLHFQHKWFGNDYEICRPKMATKFRDIADEEDRKTISYEGRQVSIESIVGKEVTFIEFREVYLHNKKKVIVQIEEDCRKAYFFSGAEKLHDQLVKYKEQMPFDATLIKVLNPKTNNTYYSLS